MVRCPPPWRRLLVAAALAVVAATAARAQTALLVQPLSERKVAELPAGELYLSSSSTTDLQSLVMFVVDANRPFSSPATLL